MKRIWLVAAENGAFRGGKVGGIADVVRDLPPALAARGHEVTVFFPAYGIFNALPEARPDTRLQVQFGGLQYTAETFQIGAPDSAVRFVVIEHGLISRNDAGVIYHHDPAGRPFATDANRFAFFCAAMAAYVEQSQQPPDVIHLQDWHTALLLALRRFDHSCKRLRATRTVYTIHNLAFQGIRPLAGDDSSFESWFPQLEYQRQLVVDPRYGDCVNPMAIAIRLADKLNTVSPTYANEILQPNDPGRGFRGGEGLEADLQKAAAERRLTGILNGCTYPGPGGRRPGWARLLAAIGAEQHLLEADPSTLAGLPRRRPANLLVSIGRIGEQKVALFLQATRTHASALESILEQHGRKLVFIMLGSGDRELEDRLSRIAAAHQNFLFLRGFSEPLPDLLYHAGDLFLMPSLFEPCGISQMLAMRMGQPCVVHAVGGLRDTVSAGVNGFAFTGGSPVEQAENFVATVNQALAVRSTDRARWRAICDNAAAMRFSWDVAAAAYLSELYEA